MSIPRKAGIVVLLALHHIIIREIGRTRIFMDDTTRNDFPDWIVLPGKASSYYLTSSDFYPLATEL